MSKQPKTFQAILLHMKSDIDDDDDGDRCEKTTKGKIGYIICELKAPQSEIKRNTPNVFLE